VLYAAPAPGTYHVHACYNELGTSESVPIRGSPFTIECADAWTKHRVAGAFPARRKGITLTALGSELVAYGGDKSGVAVCATAGDSGEWRWSSVAPEGDAPPDRTLHSATLVAGNELVVFGGTALADGSDLNDMYSLRKEGEGGAGTWVWSHPAVSHPYTRHPDPAALLAAEGSGPAAGGEGGEGEQPAAQAAEEPGEGGGEEGAAEGGEEGAAAGPAGPLPVSARNSHAAVAIDRDLYVLCGDSAGDMMREFAMCDTLDREAAHWLEPILSGDVPRPRRAAAAAATGNQIYMFGGVVAGEEGANTVVDELVAFEVTGPNSVDCVVMEVAAGSRKPAARAYPIMQVRVGVGVGVGVGFDRLLACSSAVRCEREGGEEVLQA
jgi:dynein heavy chain